MKKAAILFFFLALSTSACGILPGAAPTVQPTSTLPVLPPIAQTAPAIAPLATWTPVIASPVPPVPASASLLSEMLEAYSESPAYTILLESVVMEGDAVYADPFNSQVHLLMEREQKNFIEGLNEIEEWRAANMPDIRSTLDAAHQVTLNDHSLVSVRFEFYAFTAGAAHPVSYSKTLTYNLASGDVVLLPDLFTLGTDWLGALSSYCLRDLQERGVLEFPEGAGPTMGNYASWTLTPEGLVVYFDPYQVAAYAAGPQQVLVPYAVMSEFIAPQGVLSFVQP